MITEDGMFMKQDDYEEILKNAVIVEVICPKCKEMTRTEDLGDSWYLCMKCGNTFNSEECDAR